MHRARIPLVALLAAGVVALGPFLVPAVNARDPGTQPLTYHTGATLVCSSCHTMHYSEGGQPPPGADPGGPFPKLLLKRNETDLCLTCHGGGTAAPNVMGGNWPGGQFPATAAAEGRGHNPTGTVDNQSTQIPLDSTLGLTPPGSTRGALTEFTCGTCHDPHGFSDYDTGNAAVFTYRLLRKTIKGPGGATIDVSNTIQSTFRDEQDSEVESATNHNVYRSAPEIGDKTKGFSQWCASCHSDFHGPALGFRHPTADQLGKLYENYTLANPADGYAGGTYHFKYPVETTQGVLATTTTQWPITSGTTERVFCLSCHRAHGSAYSNAGRWDFSVKSGAGTGCNKCHGKGK
ncbi:MAG: cytochrome c3 family protein [Armatimonadota bacterium]|nr:cytochrome c3 family protein [Armatimonadota bacterium]MDR7574404.1 cytochrome c3 family protein [Armatimonadota bacterium]MDR7588777.1 cytochrome c3 family protein [Armatimonadota bacterium]